MTSIFPPMVMAPSVAASHSKNQRNCRQASESLEFSLVP